MKTCMLALASAALVSCSDGETATRKAGADGLTLKIEKHNQHPFLVDHSRMLVAHLDGKRIGAVEIYPDPGAGVPLHYVATPEEITAVDGNGVWYRITEIGIEKIGWEWMKPLPNGTIYRIARNSKEDYEITEAGPVALGDIYVYKDPSD